MKRILFFVCIIMPHFILSMEKTAKDYQKIYAEFRAVGMQQLTEEERQAIRPDNYKVRREDGTKALHVFARHVVAHAYGAKRSKILSEEKLAKKSSKYALYMIELRDISLGLKPVEITDEFTAKTYAVSLLTDEEQKSLQRDEYCVDRDKAHATLVRYAHLTAEELAQRNLLPCAREEFEQKFVEEKIKELDEMWSGNKK